MIRLQKHKVRSFKPKGHSKSTPKTIKKSPKPSQSNPEIQRSSQECLKVLDHLAHVEYQNKKQLLRSKSVLWREFSEIVQIHWYDLLQITSQTCLLEEKQLNEKNQNRQMTEVIRKIELAANQIVNFRVESQKKLEQLTEKAIVLAQEKQRRHPRNNNIEKVRVIVIDIE